MSDERDPIEPGQIAGVETAQVRIRRAPKLRVFVAIGVVVVELATVIVTLQFKPDPKIGMTATVGYMSIYGVVFGALLGAVVGLVVDAVSRRTARTVDAERALLVDPDWSVAGPDAAVAVPAEADATEAVPAPASDAPKFDPATPPARS